MTDYMMSKKDKKTFQDIVFEHLSRILEITKEEFTGGYQNTIISGNVLNKVYVSDKKEEYCQVVEALSDIIYPHYDKEMKKVHTDYETSLDQAEKKHFKEDGQPKTNDDYKMYSRERLKLTRLLFRHLNELMYRKSYLKGNIYRSSDKIDSNEEADETISKEEIVDLDAEA